MKITKKQVRLLEKQSHNGQILALSVNLKMWFPKAFEEKKPKLEVGKWYKNEIHPQMLFYCTKIKERTMYGYGFDSRGTFVIHKKTSNSLCMCNSVASRYLVHATREEVEKALESEADRRYKHNDKIQFISDENNSNLISTIQSVGTEYDFRFGANVLYTVGYGRWCVFKDGKWAKVIQETITKEDAEKQLGKKIV